MNKKKDFIHIMIQLFDKNVKPLVKSDHKKAHIMMVTHVVPYPPGAGNEIRLYRMLAWLRKKGFSTSLILKPLGDVEISNQCIEGLREIVDKVYIFDNRVLDTKRHASQHSLDFDMQDVFVREVQDGFCPQWFATDVGKIIQQSKPDVIISQYVFMSRILNLSQCAKSLKIIDSLDLFCRKHSVVEQYGIKNYGLSLTEKQEQTLLRRADIVLAIQQVEQIEIQKLIPEKCVLLTSFDVDTRHCDTNHIVPGQVLVVASGNEFNVRGTRDFVGYTWPLITERNPAARLRIVGKVCEQIITDDPSVSLLGFVPDLDAEYGQAAVVVNPCRVGTGLKIKTVEALAWGKAHVAWPSAADGLREIEGVPAKIANNIVEFADAILSLLEDEKQRKALEKNAHNFISKHFGSEDVYYSFIEAINLKSK